MATTLRDVAQHAGVSVRTVSNVVNGYAHVSTSMRKRVLASIDTLGYQANPIARTLRTGKTGTLLLVVPEIDVPYFSELAKEVIRSAKEHTYSITVTQTQDDNLTPHNPLDMRTVLYDGILLASRLRPDTTLPQPTASSLPITTLNEDSFDGIHDHVSIDNAQASYDATSHLAGLGRRRIAVIGTQPQMDFSTPAHRFKGYCHALNKAKIPFDPALALPTGHYGRAEGYTAATTLLSAENPPDAIVCFSDLLAIGAIRAAHDLGLQVPGDLAIVGIDNIPEGQFSTPSLTTISLDIPTIAKEAVRLLTARIEDPKRPAEDFLAPHKLIIRESCGAHKPS